MRTTFGTGKDFIEEEICLLKFLFHGLLIFSIKILDSTGSDLGSQEAKRHDSGDRED